eukprot:UN24990
MTIDTCNNFSIILIGGGGGPLNSGVPNGIILGRLDEQTSEFHPFAFYNTHPHIINSLVIHPKYPLQIVCALDNFIAVAEFTDFEADAQMYSVPLQENYRLQVCDSESPLNRVCFNNDGSLLASGGVDKKCRIYKYNFMEPPSHINPPVLFKQLDIPNEIDDICFSKDSAYIVIKTERSLYLSSVHTNDIPNHRFEYYKYWFRGCVFLSETELITLCFNSKNNYTYLLKWDIKQSIISPVKTVFVSKNYGKKLVSSLDGRFLAVLCLRKEVVTIHCASTLIELDSKKNIYGHAFHNGIQ